MNLVLLDFSQIVISAALDFERQSGTPITIELLRHISLSNIIYYKKKFNVSNDRLVLCYDGKQYWRKKVFPQYKQNRKIEHEKSKFDWEGFFQCFNKIKKEIQEELPFVSVEIDTCEADDVIAVLSKLLSSQYDVIIVSSDKDLLQIQRDSALNIKQWSPFRKSFISIESSNYNLFEHIVRGDSGDGVPNIFSDDDVFTSTEKKRSKPIRSKAIQEWKLKGGLNSPESFCDSPLTLERLMRNRTLIDLREIPKELVDEILQTYKAFKPSKKDIFSYLMKNKLRKILESGGI